MLHWLWLATRKGISVRRLLMILRHFGSPEDVYLASKGEYRLAGLSDAEIASLSDKSLREAQRISADCRRLKIHLLTYQDAAYPNRLRNIADPPLLLYYKGTLPDIDAEPVITVVGSRSTSPHGLLCAKRLGYQIANCGGLLASGLAIGADAMAMVGALSTRRPVIGVLGCGLDIYYPRSNQHLQDDVLQCGCLLSEYPPGTPPLGRHFPVRNRILSGIALGCVVVEAPERSGALITARLALDQGRDVYAMPGNAGAAACAGSNRLIRDGAMLVESGWDVMQCYQDAFPDQISRADGGRKMETFTSELQRYGAVCADPVDTEIPWKADGQRNPDKKSVDNPKKEDYIDVQVSLSGATEDELLVYQQLQEPLTADELSTACHLPGARVLIALTGLELRGAITHLEGGRYCRAQNAKTD